MMLVDWTPAPAFIGSLVAASVLELTGWSATNECKLLFLSLSIFCLSLRCLISKVSGVPTSDPSSDGEFHAQQGRENGAHSVGVFVLFLLLAYHSSFALALPTSFSSWCVRL